MCSRLKTLSNYFFTCLLLFLFVFFFGVYNVHAVGYQKTLEVPSGYLWQGSQTYPTINSYTHFNQTFKGFQVSTGSVSGVGFRLNMSDFNDFESSYDYTFLMSMANDPASSFGQAPQVLFANTFCSVEPLGYYQEFPQYRSNISGYFQNTGGSGYQEIMPRDNNGVMGWKNEIFSPYSTTDYASSYYYVNCKDIQLNSNSNLIEVKTSFMPSRSGTEYSVSTIYYTNESANSLVRKSNKELIESQKACSQIDKVNIKDDNKSLGGGGGISTETRTGITDYINVYNSTVKVLDSSNTTYWSTCFYNVNKQLISCVANDTLTSGQTLTLPTDTYYMRATIVKSTNRPKFEICQDGNQAIVNQQQDLNNTINNDDTSEAESSSSDFFSGFQTTDHGGLSGVVSAPLRLINSLATSTCSPLEFPLPFVEEDVSLPCMSSIYTTYFGSFFTLYQLITTGLIGYWVVVKCFARVKGIQDPKDDRIEVFDL